MQLNNADSALSLGHVSTACSQLDDVIHPSQRLQRGEEGHAAQAQQLIDDATRIKAVLGR
jgi:hypothetical protein